MATNPLVSIVLGTYNGEKYLKEQIDSIFRQTYPNIEFIITDDCSTDSTPAILREFASKHENVHVYFNETNLGLVRNFEKAVKYAQGEYIAFADQDDIWLPEKIQRLVDNIGDNMLIHHDSAYIDADGNLIGKKSSDYRHLITGKNLYVMDIDESGLWVAAHSMMFRRELLDLALPFTPSINHDGWIAYIAMLKGTIAVVPEVLVLYRQHGNNLVGGLGYRKMAKKNITVDTQNDEPQKYKRFDALLSLVPDTESEFREFLNKMRTYTIDPVFSNRIKRMALRLKYINQLYALRKRNMLRKIFRIIREF
ncbi:MAG: glycosyltransferase family 2 protein [Prevotellaceae bacterium]|jgi:glycosyltransferase involved in cell wall biosynthesis|nr:glycosyltransferase family 2 protein [Prevotellaceae bacterium]